MAIDSLILASTSAIRRQLLANAGVTFAALRPSIDEADLKQTLRGHPPARLAQALADAKALSLCQAHPEALVIGADQVLDLDGKAFDKPANRNEARRQLLRLRGKTHRLHSALAVAQAGRILWRHRASARLTMRSFSRAFLAAYIDRQGDALLTSVGGYKLEEEGAQLFARVAGDHTAILGLPLLPLLAFLRQRGVVPT